MGWRLGINMKNPSTEPREVARGSRLDSMFLSKGFVKPNSFANGARTSCPPTGEARSSLRSKHRWGGLGRAARSGGQDVRDPTPSLFRELSSTILLMSTTE